MSTLFIPIGILGSGKTTWGLKEAEKNNNFKIVSPDLIRQMLHGTYKYVEELEPLITTMCKRAIEVLLDEGYDVFIDACNLTWEARIKEWFSVSTKSRRVAVVFPTKGMSWHVDRRMTSPKGFNREYWERVYSHMSKQLDSFDMTMFDEVIEVGKDRDEE